MATLCSLSVSHQLRQPFQYKERETEHSLAFYPQVAEVILQIVNTLMDYSQQTLSSSQSKSKTSSRYVIESVGTVIRKHRNEVHTTEL